MSGNSFFAKLGVFALIAANVGAYYVFWPENGLRPPAPTEGVGHASLPKAAEADKLVLPKPPEPVKPPVAQAEPVPPAQLPEGLHQSALAIGPEPKSDVK